MVPRLGTKQQLVLDYDLWGTTERLKKALKCHIKWEWVKGHQTQGMGSKWKLEIDVNNFCDKHAEVAREDPQREESDPFFPDQKIGIQWGTERFHGSPRQAIQMASHDNNLQAYIVTRPGGLLKFSTM